MSLLSARQEETITGVHGFLETKSLETHQNIPVRAGLLKSYHSWGEKEVRLIDFFAWWVNTLEMRHAGTEETNAPTCLPEEFPRQLE